MLLASITRAVNATGGLAQFLAHQPLVDAVFEKVGEHADEFEAVPHVETMGIDVEAGNAEPDAARVACACGVFKPAQHDRAGAAAGIAWQQGEHLQVWAGQPR